MQLDTNRLHTAFNRLESSLREMRAGSVDAELGRRRIRAGEAERIQALDAYRSALLDTLTVMSATIAELREDVDTLLAQHD